MYLVCSKKELEQKVFNKNDIMIVPTNFFSFILLYRLAVSGDHLRPKTAAMLVWNLAIINLNTWLESESLKFIEVSTPDFFLLLRTKKHTRALKLWMKFIPYSVPNSTDFITNSDYRTSPPMIFSHTKHSMAAPTHIHPKLSERAKSYIIQLNLNFRFRSNNWSHHS